jgi:hypothetical protein
LVGVQIIEITGIERAQDQPRRFNGGRAGCHRAMVTGPMQGLRVRGWCEFTAGLVSVRLLSAVVSPDAVSAGQAVRVSRAACAPRSRRRRCALRRAASDPERVLPCNHCSLLKTVEGIFGLRLFGVRPGRVHRRIGRLTCSPAYGEATVYRFVATEADIEHTFAAGQSG